MGIPGRGGEFVIHRSVLLSRASLSDTRFESIRKARRVGYQAECSKAEIGGYYREKGNRSNRSNRIFEQTTKLSLLDGAKIVTNIMDGKEGGITLWIDARSNGLNGLSRWDESNITEIVDRRLPLHPSARIGDCLR